MPPSKMAAMLILVMALKEKIKLMIKATNAACMKRESAFCLIRVTLSQPCSYRMDDSKCKTKAETEYKTDKEPYQQLGPTWLFELTKALQYLYGIGKFQ